MPTGQEKAERPLLTPMGSAVGSQVQALRPETDRRERGQARARGLMRGQPRLSRAIPDSSQGLGGATPTILGCSFSHLGLHPVYPVRPLLSWQGWQGQE